MGCDESTPVRTILRRRSVLDGWLVQNAVGATLQLPTSGARVRLVFVEAHGAFCVQRERCSCQCRFTVIELGGTLLPHLTAPAVSRYFQQHVEHLGSKSRRGGAASAAAQSLWATARRRATARAGFRGWRPLPDGACHAILWW